MKSIAFVSVKKAFSVFLAFLLLFSACFVVAPVFSSAITAETSGFTASVSGATFSGEGSDRSVSVASVSASGTSVTVTIKGSAKGSEGWGVFSHNNSTTVNGMNISVNGLTCLTNQSMTFSDSVKKGVSYSGTKTFTITRTLSGVKLSGSPLKVDIGPDGAERSVASQCRNSPARQMPSPTKCAIPKNFAHYLPQKLACVKLH